MCKTKKELDKLVAKRRELRAAKKLIEEQLEQIDDDIIEYIEKKGLVSSKNEKSLVVYGKDYKASYTEITSTVLDNTLIKEYFGTSLPQYQKKSSYKRLEVS
jgi:hypothetical protein